MKHTLRPIGHVAHVGSVPSINDSRYLNNSDYVRFVRLEFRFKKPSAESDVPANAVSHGALYFGCAGRLNLDEMKSITLKSSHK